MPTRFLLALLVLLATALTAAAGDPAPPTGPAGDAASVEAAVRETNVRMTEAANRLDADGFFAFILDSAKGVIVQNGSIFRTRQEALEAVKRGFRGMSRIDRRLENVQVTVLGPDLALLVADGTTDATLTSGREISARFAVSLVFAWREGSWKVLHGHYSMPADRG